MDWLEQFVVEYLGFKEEEMNAIISHFFRSLDQDDWESIELDVEVDLEEGEDIEDYDNFLKLPTGRLAYFPDNLLRKDQLAQID